MPRKELKEAEEKESIYELPERPKQEKMMA